MRARDQWPKVLGIFSLVIIYAAVGATLLGLVNAGIIERQPIPPVLIDTGDVEQAIIPANATNELRATIDFVETKLKRANGHIDTYYPIDRASVKPSDKDTNSEAISYYLQIMSQQGDKKRFDKELTFIETYMLHPQGSYLMWRLETDDTAPEEGQNMAPDADLRALRALYIAKDKWNDNRYDKMIDTLATGLENVALIDNQTLAAYGGITNGRAWRGDETYLSYSDFQVYDRLANTRQGAWINVSKHMRNLTLGAQTPAGLYYTTYSPQEGYSNSIDGGVHSIHSMWVLVRMAESNDPVLMQSAEKALSFYRSSYVRDGRIYSAYTSEGEPATTAETAWTYALIGRAAAALKDESFSRILAQKMRDRQDLNPRSATYGAFIEGPEGKLQVGQFTMQEAILTMQEMEGLAPRFE